MPISETSLIAFEPDSASMATWTTQLNTLEQRAAEHDRFSQQLVASLAEPLRILAGRYEELRKAHVEYNTKLEKERDSSYSDLRKMKAKYDTACQEVENKRKKNDGGLKSQAAYTQQQSEMHNVKVRMSKLLRWCRLTITEYLYHSHKRHKQAKRDVL